jgi:hypothetical protein
MEISAKLRGKTFLPTMVKAMAFAPVALKISIGDASTASPSNLPGIETTMVGGCGISQLRPQSNAQQATGKKSAKVHGGNLNIVVIYHIFRGKAPHFFPSALAQQFHCWAEPLGEFDSPNPRPFGGVQLRKEVPHWSTTPARVREVVGYN